MLLLEGAHHPTSLHGCQHAECKNDHLKEAKRAALRVTKRVLEVATTSQLPDASCVEHMTYIKHVQVEHLKLHQSCVSDRGRAQHTMG
jgi:hypothetical protein